jgi:hypothetical protein
MTALEWDKVGERFFETGLDRGVLFTTGGEAVPWNGLTQVTENTTSEVKEFYLDGVKYLDHHVPGSYSAKMEAFTYPDVLDELTGVAQYAPGVYLHDQNAKVFHLSYRTGVGNDLDQELGYKVHIIYNVMALPSSSGLSTLSDKVEPAKFTWDLSGTPPQMFGARPTAHISLHSLGIGPELLETLEGLLYGTSLADPALPSMVDLLTLIEGS